MVPSVSTQQRAWVLVGLLFTAAVAGGAIMAATSQAPAEHGAQRGDARAPTSCELHAAGFPLSSTGAAPVWDTTVISILPQAVCVAFALLRFVLLPALVAAWLPHLDPGKRSKVCNYLHELAGTTATLAVFSCYGCWGVLFEAGRTQPPTAAAATDLATAANICTLLCVWCYVVEMLAEDSMRLELKLHHALSVLMITWGVIVTDLTRMEPHLARTGLALLLYMMTEQNVFVTMLMYYKSIYWPNLFLASAWAYVATRLAIAAVCINAFSGVVAAGVLDRSAAGQVQHPTHHVLVYGYALVYVPAVLILSAVQVASSRSLFGIARAVAAKAEAAAAAINDDGSAPGSRAAPTPTGALTPTPLTTPKGSCDSVTVAIDVVLFDMGSGAAGQKHRECMGHTQQKADAWMDCTHHVGPHSTLASRPPLAHLEPSPNSQGAAPGAGDLVHMAASILCASRRRRRHTLQCLANHH